MDTENKIVKIHSAAIHVENKVGLKARLSWYYMFYKAFPKIKEQNNFTITIGELKKAIGYTSKNNNSLKEALSELARTEVQWNIFGKDNNYEWGITHLLSECRIRTDSNHIYYEYSSFVRDKLKDPEMYAKINLLISKNFKSKHSLAIYCLALDYLFIKNNYGEKNISLDEIKKYLGLTNKEYSTSGEFYKHVIKKSENEINKNSDMNIKIEPLRTERLKIVGFKLKMSIKENFLDSYKQPEVQSQKRKNNQLNLFQQIEKPKDNNFLTVKPDLISVSNDILNEFFAYNSISLTPKTIQNKLKELKEKLGESFEDYLVFLMEYTKKESNKSNIKSISGFYIGLIKDDLQVSNYKVLNQKDIQKKEESKEKLNIILEEKLRSKYKNYAFEDFRTYLLINQDSLEEKITELLNENLRDKNQFVYDMLIKQFGELDIRALTKSSVAIKSAVVGFLKNYKEELEYPETSFEYWRNQIIDEEDIMKLREEVERGLKG